VVGCGGTQEDWGKLRGSEGIEGLVGNAWLFYVGGKGVKAKVVGRKGMGEVGEG